MVRTNPATYNLHPRPDSARVCESDTEGSTDSETKWVGAKKGSKSGDLGCRGCLGSGWWGRGPGRGERALTSFFFWIWRACFKPTGQLGAASGRATRAPPSMTAEGAGGGVAIRSIQSVTWRAAEVQNHIMTGGCGACTWGPNITAEGAGGGGGAIRSIQFVTWLGAAEVQNHIMPGRWGACTWGPNRLKSDCRLNRRGFQEFQWDSKTDR